ncbi:MAG: NlpC/P60 family protein [Ilumatobacteraceae bacterium]
MGQQATKDDCIRLRRTPGSTLRSKIGILALAGASCLGGIAVTIQPAAAAPVAVTGSKPVVRDDGLAPIAATALADLQTYLRNADSESLREYLNNRDAIAGEIASRLDTDPARLIAAWNEADYTHQAAVMAALTQLGVPYKRLASKPGVGLDCSGLTTYAWGVAGTTIIRQSGGQINAASPRTAETAMAGDLMYYPGHVMMYLGIDRAMVHSPYTGRTVEVDNLSARKSVRFGNPIG